MQIKCPYCQTAIEVAASGQFTCGQCRAIFRVDLGEAPAAPSAAPPAAAGAAAGAPPAGAGAPPPASGGAAAPAASGAAALSPTAAASPAAEASGLPKLTAPPAGARCAKHPEAEAASVCTRCGTFSCALCTVPLAAGPHCPSCAERARASGRQTPWDRRRELGWFPAAKETVRRVLREPAEFFRDMPREGGYESPITFVMLMMLVQALFTVVVFLVLGVLGGVLSAAAGKGGEEVAGFAIQMFGQSIFGVCMSPVNAIIDAFVYGAIMHVCLLICGAGKNGFEATVRAICYTSAYQFLGLLIIPLAIVGVGIGALGGVASGKPEIGLISGGSIFGLGTAALYVYMIALSTIAIRETHDTTTGRALGAILLPLVVLICCVGGFVGLIAGLAGR